MLTKAGTEGKQIVFLFSDNQIKDESFVEDINMILNTGDVPNIFPADEKADIIEKMQMRARTEVGKLLLWLLLCESLGKYARIFKEKYRFLLTLFDTTVLLTGFFLPLSLT